LPDTWAQNGFDCALIPYNPTGMYDGSTSKSIAAFKAALDRTRLPATVSSRAGVTFKLRTAS
jgi:hypothetical protein